MHYYFNCKVANPEDQAIIDQYIKTATKFRGAGIDIRSNGGYVVAPPSVRDGVAYAVTNASTPIDMPRSLIDWLLEDNGEYLANGDEAPVVGPKRLVEKAEYNYDITEEQMKDVLNKLDHKYLNNYSDWFMVTSVCKHHDMHDVWDEWSKQSDRYNRTKNEQQWNYNKGLLDISYLIWKNGDKTIEPFQKYRPYTPITKDISGIKQVTFNETYVSDGLDYDTFESHDTIIIKSCTGTGKTTCIANHMEQYMDQDTKFLSIVTRTSLADQHQKSFEAINMQNYQDIKGDLGEVKALSVCLNSLHRLKDVDEYDMQDYVVYIDEVSSFAEFTNNDTLDGVMKQTVRTLTKFLRLAKKVIVSDALINDNTFELLKCRSKTIMLTNEFKKYDGVNAIRLRSAQDFLDKLVEHCGADKPFLFGCDSCKVVT